jgi:hypothetical protein
MSNLVCENGLQFVVSRVVRSGIVLEREGLHLLRLDLFSILLQSLLLAQALGLAPLLDNEVLVLLKRKPKY